MLYTYAVQPFLTTETHEIEPEATRSITVSVKSPHLKLDLSIDCEEAPEDKEDDQYNKSASQKMLANLTDKQRTISRSSRQNTNSKEVDLNKVLSKSSNKQGSLSEVDKGPLKIKKYDSLREEARQKVDTELKAMKTMKQVKERKEQDISLDDDELSKSLKSSSFRAIPIAAEGNTGPKQPHVVSSHEIKQPPKKAEPNEPRYSEDDEYRDSHQASQLKGLSEQKGLLDSLNATPKGRSTIGQSN